MVKIYMETLIKYFENIEKKLKGRKLPKYDDYIFPVEITAEYIAKKFGVSRLTILRKLRQLENDDIIVSKRGYVKGKPGKSLVFFLKAQLFDDRMILSRRSESSPVNFGYRELIYNKYNKIIDAKINGDAMVTYHYAIKNISNREITEIPLPKIYFDTYGSQNIYDRLIKIEINGKIIPYSSGGLIYYQKSKTGILVSPSNSTFSEQNYISEVVYVVPLEKVLKPGGTIDIKLITHVPKCFSNLFEFEGGGSEIQEITMKASIQINAPKGYSIKQLKRYENAQFKNGIIIVDAVTEMRKRDLEEEVKPPTATENSIYWEVDKPIIGYRYLIPFIVIKK